jgi:hypothetical protein
VSSSTAVDREVAWLTQVDALPTLLAVNSGPWDIVQAYWPRSLQTRKSGIYVLRTAVDETRFANQRKIQNHAFRAKLWWPIGGTTTGIDIAEDEQRAFDAAIDLLVSRIRGTPFDHTHGSFLSVAEDGGRISVRFADPEQTTGASPACLRAEVTWSADDRDFTG